MCNIDLKGKRILITGASGGLGMATAQLVSRSGGVIALLGRDKEKLSDVYNSMAGQGHNVYCYDLTDPSGIEELMMNIVSDMGRLDGMVHCAGVSPFLPLADTVYKKLHDIMLINFYAFVELVRNFSKKKINNSGGSIIGISSVSSIKGEKSRVAYSASKGAMDSAVRSMASELRAKGIRINSIQPAWIKTQMYDDFARISGENITGEIADRQFTGISSAESIGNIITFLLSDMSMQITGSNIIADGGYLLG